MKLTKFRPFKRSPKIISHDKMFTFMAVHTSNLMLKVQKENFKTLSKSSKLTHGPMHTLTPLCYAGLDKQVKLGFTRACRSIK